MERLLKYIKSWGPGFLESVYEEALAVEFELRDVPFERQRPITLQYKSRGVGGALVVELKAVEAIHPIFPAKVIHYLKVTGLELGLIINFHVVQLRDGVKRIVLP